MSKTKAPRKRRLSIAQIIKEIENAPVIDDDVPPLAGGWNYRLIRRVEKRPGGGYREPYYQIHSAHYREQAGKKVDYNGIPLMWSETPNYVLGETRIEALDDMMRMMQAFCRPVLQEYKVTKGKDAGKDRLRVYKGDEVSLEVLYEARKQLNNLILGVREREREREKNGTASVRRVAR